MDNLAIARVLAEIGDLLEIKGENPFKIRAYRNAADTITHLPERVASLNPAERLGIPGIGKDLAAKIAELVDAGTCRVPSGTAAGVSSDHPRPAAPAGSGTEDRGAPLPRAGSPDPRRSRARRARRAHPLAEGHGREEGGAHPQGARGAPALHRPAPDCRGARPCRDARRGAARAGARRRHRPGGQPSTRL